MTAAQEQMELDVVSLKKRTSSLEEEIRKGGVHQLEELDFEIKKSKAELNVDIDRIREEMASLRGGIEVARHELELSRESLATLEMKIDEEKISTTIIKSLQKRTTDTEARISSMDSRLIELERKVVLKTSVKEDIASKKPDPLYNKSLLLLKDRDYENALNSFKEFIELFPDHELTDNAQYWIGEIFYAKGDWERAILEFDDVIKKYPKGDKVPAALLKEGLSFSRLGAKKESRLLLTRVIENYPKSNEADIAKKKLDNLDKTVKQKGKKSN
jgi:tol-pal system protein YbgF